MSLDCGIPPTMAEESTRKTSFSLGAATKRKLESLKSELRFEDYADVTEGAIVDVLIDGAKLADLKRHFKKRR